MWQLGSSCSLNNKFFKGATHKKRPKKRSEEKIPMKRSLKDVFGKQS